METLEEQLRSNEIFIGNTIWVCVFAVIAVITNRFDFAHNQKFRFHQISSLKSQFQLGLDQAAKAQKPETEDIHLGQEGH